MARYRHIDFSPRLLPVDLHAQLVPGTFAHALHHLIDQVDLSAFDALYRNDDDGAPALPPAVLLKAVLLGYSQGLISSRAIERACRDNVLFVAVTGDAKPHFTTIAAFIRRSPEAISRLFGDVLVVMDNAGLISRDMFAVDGVKLPSNASKLRSGTRADLVARAEKLERRIAEMLTAHGRADDLACDATAESAAHRKIDRMARQVRTLRRWLDAHPEERMGARGKPVQSNLTDNESAKLATDKGVIQGYCAVAVVDAAHQVIIQAQAHGTSAEAQLLGPVMDACAAQRRADTLITADAGYHSEEALKSLADAGINALIADPDMRHRDARLTGRQRHRDRKDPLHDKSGHRRRSRLFTTDDFQIAEDASHALCPAGKRLYRNGAECMINGYRAIKFRAPKGACAECPLRGRCLRKPESGAPRQMALMMDKPPAHHTEAMRQRIDTPEGRAHYARRMGTVEPVFGNLRHNKRLNRFTLRGRRKVDAQWKLYALVHNIEKYGRLKLAP